MKRILLAITLGIFALASCSPLTLLVDSTDSKGARTLLTSNQKLMGGFKGDMDVALGAKVEGKDTVMAVLITVNADSGHGIFNQGNQLKFRLNDDSVISLTNLYDKEFETKEETYVANRPHTQIRYAYAYDYFMDDIWVTPYTVNSMIPEVRTSRYSYSYALYLITKKQLNDIITKGVKKLRVEIENDEIDMQDPSGVSALFADMAVIIRDGLKNTHVRSQF